MLAVLLLGLGISAVTVGIIFSTQDLQNATTALHKQAQAQAKAWQAMEMVRIALQSLSATALADLPEGDLALTGLEHITARVTANVAGAAGRRITVQLTAVGSASNSASTTIEAIYQVTPASSGGGGGTTISSVSAVNIRGNLRMRGDLKVLGSNQAQVNVDGDVDLGGSVEGIDKLCATGNVELRSNISVGTVCANGDLTVAGSGAVTTAIVKGNVVMSGAASITTLTANGNVTLSHGSAHADSIATKGNVSISGGSAYARVIQSESNVDWTGSSSITSSIRANGNVSFSANSPATDIAAGGNVTLSGNGNVHNVSNLGNVTLKSSWSKGIQGTLTSAGNLTYEASAYALAGKVKGSITAIGYSYNPVRNVTRDPTLSVTYTPVAVATINNQFDAAPQVDVYALEGSANYAFKINANDQKIVIVRSVNTIPDGSYFLADYATNGFVDYLCTSLNAAGKCSVPANPIYPICQGHSAQSHCFTYNANLKKWSVNGTTMAAGVAWFEGSLEVSNGTYFNTFAATCDISTGGNMRTYAPNYVGYAGICQNSSAYDRNAYAPFAAKYPKEFCEAPSAPGTLAGSYQAQPLGNVALVAGSYVNGVFQCGQVSLGASNEVWGSVVAGNNLAVTGSTTVHGQVYAAGQSISSVSNSTGGSATIDLRNLPATFSPGLLPCTVNCQSGASTPSARVFWSKYL